MLGSDLKRLAQAAAIAKLDTSPNAVVLLPGTDGPDGTPQVTAWYQGNYTACALYAPGVITGPAAVSAADLARLAALFDDGANVALQAQHDQGLVLQAGGRGRRATLRPDTRTMGYEVVLALDEPYITAPLLDLKREVGLAVGCAATSVAVPILTGVRITASAAGQRMGYQAADGISLMYQAVMPADVHRDGLAVIAPGPDLLAALGVLDGATVDIGLTPNGRALILRSPGGIVKVPTLPGTWPDLASVTRMAYDRGAVTIPAESIRACVAAARIYAVSQDCTLRPDDSTPGIILESQAGEAGHYQEPLPDGPDGAPQAMTGAAHFAIADLEQAARIAAGTGADTAVTLNLAETMARADIGGRRLYMLQKVAYTHAAPRTPAEATA